MVLISSLLFFGFIGSNSVFADVNTVNLAVNGTLVDFPDQKPYIDYNNRTMVPVRFPAETLGANVDWLPDTRQVHITNKAHDALKDTDIMATIDRKDVIVNGQTKYMDTTAVITNSRTMVPVRFISEYLGATVTWDNGNRVAHVFSKGQTKEEQDKYYGTNSPRTNSPDKAGKQPGDYITINCSVRNLTDSLVTTDIGVAEYGLGWNPPTIFGPLIDKKVEGSNYNFSFVMQMPETTKTSVPPAV